jgi:hypothetical protein
MKEERKEGREREGKDRGRKERRQAERKDMKEEYERGILGKERQKEGYEGRI